MDRFPFLDLYIRFARIVAAVVAIGGIVQAFRLWDLGFFAFVLTLGVAVFWAFMILVGADVVACFKAIEANTRKPAP
jgi:hypothetical protein